MTARETKSADIASEALLALASILAVAGFWRLFAGWGFFWRLTAFALAAHAIGAIGRRRGLGMGAVVAASLVGVVLVATWTLYWSHSAWGIPTADTFDVIRTDLGRAYDEFNAVRPPAPATSPLLLTAGIFVFWAAIVADWAAFRLRYGFEALVPIGSVFIFGSLLGEPRGQVPLTAAFVLLGLGFLLTHRIAQQQATSGWIGRAGSDGPGALLRAGAIVVVIATLGAALLGPVLPGSDSTPIWKVRKDDGTGDSERVVTSPLVDLRKRLLDQTNTELFTVKADQRAYWRLTALDSFVNETWVSNAQYHNADGTLPSDIDRNGQTVGITQDYKIVALASPWLPAAFEATKVKSDTRITWSSDLSTLILGGSAVSADGISYTAQSVYPVFDPNELANATGDIPDKVKATDLTLPSDFSPRATADAHQVTDGAATTYDKALALQDWFRNEFTYDLSVTAGENVSAIDDFLDSRRGYCQQFAGSFAAMARAIGIPARVAVGYTVGEADPGDPTLFHVKGTHAHAWPEVYIAGQGWVPFEPTPGRGIPNAEQYTHVPEQQSTSDGTGTATTVPASAVTVPATTTPSQGGAATTVPDERTSTDAAKPDEPWLSRWYVRVGLVLLGIVVLAGLYVLLVPALNRHRRRTRRERAADSSARVGVAWEEGVDAVSLLGIVPARAETPVEFATRVEPEAGTAPWIRLAELLETADFAADGVGDAEADEALAIADHIDAEARARATAQQRWRADLDPRPRDRRLDAGRRRGAGRGPRSRRDAPSIEVIELPR